MTDISNLLQGFQKREPNIYEFLTKLLRKVETLEVRYNQLNLRLDSLTVGLSALEELLNSLTTSLTVRRENVTIGTTNILNLLSDDQLDWSVTNVGQEIKMQVQLVSLHRRFNALLRDLIEMGFELRSYDDTES